MSSSDLKELKQRIYKEERIAELLEKLGCDHIKPENGGNLFTASLPNGDNRRSVQIYNNEWLNSSIVTRAIRGDIYNVVSYILFECSTDDEFSYNLPKVKKWIAEQLGYPEFLNGVYKPAPKLDVISWLKDIKRKRSKEIDLDSIEQNSILDESIKDEYFMLPHMLWIEEGISWDTQKEFECGFDPATNRIVVMIRDRFGDLIGVKGRTLDNDYEIWDIPKYLYLWKMNKSIELYGLHRAMIHILEQKEIIIFEGFKSVMKAWQYGFKNCVSIEGDNIHPAQIALIKSLGLDIKVTLCFDKDKSIKSIKDQAKKIINRELYAVYDKENKLSEKQAPVDAGEDVWNFLYWNKFIIPAANKVGYNKANEV